jgi:hypothetical protein
MLMVNKRDDNIISSLFITGTNKPSKETIWKFLNYLWNNRRTQENIIQVNIKSSHTPPLPPHLPKRGNINSHTVLQGLHNPVL